MINGTDSLAARNDDFDGTIKEILKNRNKKYKALQKGASRYIHSWVLTK
jgi:hypothetical protein